MVCGDAVQCVESVPATVQPLGGVSDAEEPAEESGPKLEDQQTQATSAERTTAQYKTRQHMLTLHEHLHHITSSHCSLYTRLQYLESRYCNLDSR